MFNDFPKSVRIKKIADETPLVRSYSFEYPVRALPGQFVNVWVAGADEKPISVAYDDGKCYTLAIAAVGCTTQGLLKKKAGDYIGIRGPYGTHYTWQRGEHIALLSGGYGAAPLYFAASRAVKAGCRVDFFLGARSKEHLLFVNRIKKLANTRFFPSTDDGSYGFKGFNIELWIEQMKNNARYDSVMTCGPEMMMKEVSDIAEKHKIPAQISVERYMKCGLGICGNCCVDDLGVTTCQNGPVMPSSTVRKIKEFGVYRRDSCGRKQFFNKQASPKGLLINTAPKGRNL